MMRAASSPLDGTDVAKAGPSAPFTEEEMAAAARLIRQHGDEVHNIATDAMIEALRGGQLDGILHWIRMRRCITATARKERFTRRITDKLIWSIEQAFEQGRLELLRALHGAYEAALSIEQQMRRERRRQDPPEQ